MESIEGSKGQLEAALRDYDHDKLGANSAKVEACQRKWWALRARKCGLTPFPLTPAKNRLAASLLKAGGYRSAMQYIATIKKVHIRREHPWSEAMALEIREAKLSVNRGIGPSRNWPGVVSPCLRTSSSSSIEAPLPLQET